MSDAPVDSALVRNRRPVLITLTILLSAIVLRAPIVALAPVATQLSGELAVSPAGIGVLTTIPVLCFALATPVAVWITQRLGVEAALSLCLAGTGLGCLVRSSGDFAGALAGTAIIGAFVTIGNVVVPVIIARDYPATRARFMTGVYAAAINVGTVTVTVATVPLSGAFGWRTAIASSAFAAVAAIAVWVGARGARGALLPAPRVVEVPSLAQEERALRHPVTLLLGVAFAGQSFAYYAVTAWLPAMMQSAGYAASAAGGMASVFQLFGLAGALGVPFLVSRWRLPASFVIVTIAWLAAPIGYATAPQLWVLWGVIGGFGQAAGFTLVFIAVVAAGGSSRAVTARSGAVQGMGYTVGAFGSLVVGALHDATGAWIPAMAVVVIALCGFGVFGVSAVRRIPR